MSRTVHICIASSSGAVIIDRAGSTRETHCAVEGVPDNLHAASVILQVSKIVFTPWPKTIVWGEIKDLPPGSHVKENADG